MYLLSGLSLVLSGVVVVVVAEAAARSHLGANGGAGIRLPSLMSSPKAWRLGHRRARVPLDLGGAVLVAGGLFGAFAPSSTASNIWILVSMITALGAVGIGTMLAVRAARHVAKDGESPPAVPD